MPRDDDGAKVSYAIVRRQLWVLSLFPFSEAIAWTSIFPYIYAMTEWLAANSDKDNRNAALSAGVMVSVFTFGEFIMAPQWAAISDRIGRKPTLLIGSFGAIFSALVFGFTRSLPLAVASRFFAGMLNPNLGVVPTFVGELVSKDQQAQGFSVVPFIQGFGRLLGPVIGGYLAEPTKNAPRFFAPGSFWERYPYLLPNLVVVTFLTTSCILGFLFLQEVHPDFRNREGFFSSLQRRLRSRTRHGVNTNIQAVYSSVAGSDEEIIEMEDAGDSVKPEVEPLPPTPYTRQVKYQILSNTLQGFIKIANLALIPIFLAAPSIRTNDSATGTNVAHGLNLDTKGISNMLLSTAVAAILAQIFIVPRTIKRLGPLPAFQLGLLASMAAFILTPFTASLPRSLGIGTMVVMLWVQAYLNGVMGASSQILITNTSPSPRYLARINGAATSIGCLGRTLGPAVSGWLSQVGQTSGYTGLPFWVIAVMVAVNYTVARTLMQDHP